MEGVKTRGQNRKCKNTQSQNGSLQVKGMLLIDKITEKEEREENTLINH